MPRKGTRGLSAAGRHEMKMRVVRLRAEGWSWKRMEPELGIGHRTAKRLFEEAIEEGRGEEFQSAVLVASCNALWLVLDESLKAKNWREASRTAERLAKLFGGAMERQVHRHVVARVDWSEVEAEGEAMLAEVEATGLLGSGE